MNAKKYTIYLTGEPEPIQTIYAGLESIFPEFAGEFLVTTCGDPETRISLVDAAAYADNDVAESIAKEIAEIESIISEGDGEDLADEDLEYLRDWMRIYGVIE